MRPLSAPVKVSIDVTSECNLNCLHCRCRFRGDGGARGELSSGELRAVIDDLADMRVFRLGLSGGEPFLRGDLPAIVAYALDVGIPRVFVSTNGTLLDERSLRPFARWRDRLTFKVSLDGPARVHDEVRQSCGAFEAATGALRLLAGLGFTTQVTTTLMSRTLPHVAETMRIAAGAGASRHYIVEVIPGVSPDVAVPLSAGQRKRAARDIERTAGRIDNGRYCVVAKIPFADGENFDFECSAGISECGILSDGLIVGCRLLPAVNEGCVRDAPLSRVWRSPDGFRYFRELLPGCLGRPCIDCPVLETCRGGCRACAPREGGGGEGPDARCPRATVGSFAEG